MTATVARLVVGFIFMVFMAMAPGRNCFSLVFLRIILPGEMWSVDKFQPAAAVRQKLAGSTRSLTTAWQTTQSRSLPSLRLDLSTESSEQAESG